MNNNPNANNNQNNVNNSGVASPVVENKPVLPNQGQPSSTVPNQSIPNPVINNVAPVIPVDQNQQPVVNSQMPVNPQSDNIVAPTAVDLSKVQVNNADNFINRERDNIVSATIQANEAIDKDKATDVNNQIKVKKFTKSQLILIVLVVVIVACAAAFGVVKLANKIMTFDEKEKTVATTKSLLQLGQDYLTRLNTIRKFQNNNYILILSPEKVDMKDNNLYYLYLNYSMDGIISEEAGIYVIQDNKLILTNRDNVAKEFEITSDGLVAGDILLKKNDAEMKYYQFESDYLTKTLIINGTLKNERALWIRSAKEGSSYQIDTVTENDTTITFGTSDVFTKKDMNIVHNNEEYKFMS